MDIQSAYASRRGRGRRENQDRFLAGSRCWAVASGSGPVPGGESAAQIAIDTLWTFMTHASSFDLVAVLTCAHRSIQAMGEATGRVDSAATTMTAVRVETQRDGSVLANVAHVGPSKMFVVRNRSLVRVAGGHGASALQEPAVAQYIRTQPVMAQVLGRSDTPYIWSDRFPLLRGDRIVLCTDGVTEVLSNADVARVVDCSADSRELADRLTWSAQSAHSHRDTTVLVADIGASQKAKPSHAGADWSRYLVPA